MKVEIGWAGEDEKELLGAVELVGSDMWNLNHVLAMIIAPCIKLFRENIHGYPASLSGEKEWDDILEKMQTAFEIVERDDIDERMIRSLEIEEGLLLFARYFENLWD